MKNSLERCARTARLYYVHALSRCTHCIIKVHLGGTFACIGTLHYHLKDPTGISHCRNIALSSSSNSTPLGLRDFFPSALTADAFVQLPSDVPVGDEGIDEDVAGDVEPTFDSDDRLLRRTPQLRLIMQRHRDVTRQDSYRR